MLQADHVRIVGGSRREGPCRTCHRPLVWGLTPKGKWMPFDGDPQPLRTEQDPTTLVRYEFWARALVHFANCPAWARSRPRRSSPAR